MANYRDELIQTIKLMGQELIDRAESMVHEDCDMITNFNINIDIPQPIDGYPDLTWSTSTLSKNFYNKEIGHSAGDAKMETHIESVTVEKKETFIIDDPTNKTITVVFPTRGDAEVCLDQLDRLVEVYSCVDLGDLYRVCNMPFLPENNIHHGWVSMTSVSVKRDERGYCICLPYPTPLV